MKPLYLDGSKPLCVLLDGPALRVVCDGRADGRVPLRRLSRVISRGAVEWSAPALAACMAEDIPIAFLDPRGQPLGYCLGAVARPTDFNQWLADFVARPDWPDRFDNWRRAAERREILLALKQVRASAEDLRPTTLWPALERAARDAMGSSAATIDLVPRLSGLLAADLPALLRAEGIAPRYIATTRGGLGLAAAFHLVLRWSLWPLALRLGRYFAAHGAKHREERDVHRRILRHYEGERRHIARRFDVHFGRLLLVLADPEP